MGISPSVNPSGDTLVGICPSVNPSGRHPGGCTLPFNLSGRHPGGYIPLCYPLREAPWWVYTVIPSLGGTLVGI